MEKLTIEQIEMNLVLAAVKERYGYDFSHYARATVERRLRQLCIHLGANRLSEIIPDLLYDESFLKTIIDAFSTRVTGMFRDPFVFRQIRQQVIPVLKALPFIKIWIAGCATGEEAYTMAILLEEEGLSDQIIFYATDFNDSALDQAKSGVYQGERVGEFKSNYIQAGGSRSFSLYYNYLGGAISIKEELRNRITFANHNLITDGVFGEMNMIFCRNVLIYFDKFLQNNVLKLFRDSLASNGFLCLGTKESIRFSSVRADFKTIDEKSKIYQLIT